MDPTPSTRLDLWPSLLEEALTAARAKTFQWGEHDCCLFVSDCILAMTGKDPAEKLRGTYDSPLGAARILSELGGLEGLVKSRGYVERPSVNFAQAGDIVYVDTVEGEGLGICLGAQVVCLAPEGLRFLPITKATKVWEV